MPGRPPARVTLSSRDTGLVLAIRRGDVDAFETVFRAHEPLMYRICLYYVRSSAVAADLVQDVFCDVWDRRRTWCPKTSLQAYLAGAARKRSLRWLRRSRRRTSLDAWADAAEVADGSPSPGTPLDALLFVDLRGALREAVEQLPARRRLIYSLAREHHYTYAQVADALGISESTVKTQMGRAVRFLRESLQTYREPGAVR